MNLQELLDLDISKIMPEKKHIYEHITQSLVSSWKINTLNYNFTNNIINLKNNIQNNFYTNNSYTSIEYKDYIKKSFDNNNNLNNIAFPELSNNQVKQIYLLHCKGLEFVFKSCCEIKIDIRENDVIFPICCIGKNRSQYLFYYFKFLQAQCKDKFFVGYPSSADELYTMVESKSSSLSTILSGFTVQHKKDCFSSSIQKTFGFEVSRSIHVLDKLLKNPEEFNSNELTNFEQYKYKSNKYDIYEKEYIDVKLLFLKYFVNPSNIINLLNNIFEEKKNYRITYICASPQSFIKLTEIFYILSQTDKEINFNNTRIIYLGINDIFQRSSVNQIELDNLNIYLKDTFVII